MTELNNAVFFDKIFLVQIYFLKSNSEVEITQNG